MTPRWLTAEQQRVWRNYLSMGSRLQAAMNRQLQRDCGLSLSDYEVLVVLSERGPLRIFQLNQALAWEQSRLSHQLSRMRGRNLIERQESDQDKRGATVAITDTGQEALAAAAPGHAGLVHAMLFDGMTPGQLQALDALTTRALSRLADENARPDPPGRAS